MLIVTIDDCTVCLLLHRASGRTDSRSNTPGRTDSRSNTPGRTDFRSNTPGRTDFRPNPHSDSGSDTPTAAEQIQYEVCTYYFMMHLQMARYLVNGVIRN